MEDFGFLKTSVAIITALILATVIWALFSNLRQSASHEPRQPLQVEITETDSPFRVSDYHDEVRERIDEAIGN